MSVCKCVIEPAKGDAVVIDTTIPVQRRYKVDVTHCELHRLMLDFEKKAAVKEERRRIQQAIQGIPNYEEVSRLMFAPPKAVEAPRGDPLSDAAVDELRHHMANRPIPTDRKHIKRT